MKRVFIFFYHVVVQPTCDGLPPYSDALFFDVLSLFVDLSSSRLFVPLFCLCLSFSQDLLEEDEVKGSFSFLYKYSF